MRIGKNLQALAGAAMVATLALAGCSSGTSPAPGTSGTPGGSAGALTVVASTNVWGDVAGQVGGDRIAVTSIIDRPDADPHEYQASSRNQLALSQAQVVIENGGGYDDFVDTMLSSADNADATVINAVDVSGRTAGAGEELNEHVWYDYPTVEKVAGSIRDALSAKDPDGASTYAANTETFLAGVRQLTSRTDDLKSTYAGEGAAVTEPVPGYLLEATGLENKTPDEFSEAIEEDSDVPPKVLQETLDLFSNHDVVVLLHNDQVTGPQTDQVKQAAEDANIPVVGVQETLPSGKDYLTWQNDILDALEKALAQK